MNSYNGLKTTLQHKGAQIEVPLLRGVKQGDPLSPFIFNAIMNPLLEQLEEMKGVTLMDQTACQLWPLQTASFSWQQPGKRPNSY
jgi:hypothetical protein